MTAVLINEHACDLSQVHKEKWVSPYNGGAELAGCGGGEGNFAKKAALERGRLQVYATV